MEQYEELPAITEFQQMPPPDLSDEDDEPQITTTSFNPLDTPIAERNQTNPKRLIISLQDENRQLRDQMRALSEKLDDIIAKTQHKKQILIPETNDRTKQEMLKTALKKVEFYKAERARLQAATNKNSGFQTYIRLQQTVEAKESKIKDLEKSIKDGVVNQRNRSKNLERLDKEKDQPEDQKKMKEAKTEHVNLKAKLQALQDKHSRDHRVYEQQYEQELDLIERLDKLKEIAQHYGIQEALDTEAGREERDALLKRLQVSDKAKSSLVYQYRIKIKKLQGEYQLCLAKQDELAKQLRDKKIKFEEQQKVLKIELSKVDPAIADRIINRIGENRGPRSASGDRGRAKVNGGFKKRALSGVASAAEERRKGQLQPLQRVASHASVKDSQSQLKKPVLKLNQTQKATIQTQPSPQNQRVKSNSRIPLPQTTRPTLIQEPEYPIKHNLPEHEPLSQNQNLNTQESENLQTTQTPEKIEYSSKPFNISKPFESIKHLSPQQTPKHPPELPPVSQLVNLKSTPKHDSPPHLQETSPNIIQPPRLSRPKVLEQDLDDLDEEII